MSYLWHLHVLSMAVACAIYGSYMSYPWRLHELSVVVTCAIYGSYGGQPGNMASSFCNHYILFLVL